MMAKPQTISFELMDIKEILNHVTSFGETLPILRNKSSELAYPFIGDKLVNYLLNLPLLQLAAYTLDNSSLNAGLLAYCV
jgi:hypothetical protein